MLKLARVTVPDGGGFPSAAAIHDYDCRILKALIGVTAQGVRQMVIHIAKSRLAQTEYSAERCGARFLMPHACEVAGRIQDVQIRNRPPAGRVKLQIVAKNLPGWLPAETYFINLTGSDLRKIQARLNRQ